MEFEINGRTINILGVEYKIAVKELTHNNLNMGHIDDMTATIALNVRLPKSQMQAVLWHEVVHGVLDAIGESEMSKNEDFVEKLSRALNTVADLKLEGGE